MTPEESSNESKNFVNHHKVDRIKAAVQVSH